MRSIGELARASGLTVSALRFYDSAGVLVPALVDPVTGYRWYADDQLAPARLVAGLRRIGMPVAEIAAAVRAEPAAVHRLLDVHLRRLEDGLADARRELSRIRALVGPEKPAGTVRIALSRAELAYAIDAVRFAVGTDPELPALTGVLFDVAPDGLRLVTTDRHRLALARAGATRPAGPAVRVLAPAGFVDEVRALLDGDAAPEARLSVADDTITVSVADRTVTVSPLPYDFPDYRRLLRVAAGDAPAYRIPVDAVALRTALRRPGAPTIAREYDGVPIAVSVLGVDDRGGLRVLEPEEAGPGDGLRFGVNGDYLLDALDAAGGPQLVLELDGPITPLAVRRPDDDAALSILMPIRL
ncbi:MerR family DNA-binding transcriptional regulator [Micromonospora sp. 15K316]|uniref:DNA polymerase III subunit beta family protein n=1 Tax=Micromonospora sp. 15K316 TaxID=2530376 RepID=UPI001052A1A6|nr:MerR family transcriptional regulator [Micromonospora sp. 15K316]TDC39669.1 MerR family DNA-binding transcriptional regulator [Micromonospora sp. 15K316]